MVEKGIPPLNKIEDEIERIWTEEIKRDFLERKILYYEGTLQGAFYHYLRPFIDQYPRLRMFLEYRNDDLKCTYDLLIQKGPRNEKWVDQGHWMKEIGDYWIVMEFKFVPKLSDKGAQKDIQKFQKLKKYDESIKRVYFCSIDKNVKLHRYVNYRGTWYDQFYREARGVLRKNEWDFFVLKPEDDWE